MDDWGGCIVALIVLALVVGVVVYAFAGVGLALAYGGLTAIIAIEFLAHGLATIGITNPLLAWLFLGLLIGGAVGFALGLGKAGKKAAKPLVYVAGGAILVLLLVLSASAPKYVSQDLPRTKSALIPERGDRAWWQGFVGNSAASLETYISENGSSAGVVTYGGVQENVNVEARDDASIVLQGTEYRRFNGQGSFNLDRFEGRLQRSGERLEGRYRDTGGNAGRWWFQRDAVVPWDSPTATRDVTEDPTSLVGEWLGTVRQPNNPLGYNSALQLNCASIGQQCGTVRYLELRCLANLVYRGWSNGSHHFYQVVTGNGDCINGPFDLAPNGAVVSFQWAGSGARGRGTLRHVLSGSTAISQPLSPGFQLQPRDSADHQGQSTVPKVTPDSSMSQEQASQKVDCRDLSLRLYNVDDYLQAMLANSASGRQTILSATERQDTGFVDISSHTQPGINTLTFQLTNYQGGYTYGYQLRSGSTIVNQASCGDVGIRGCNNNEFRLGVVFTHNFAFECVGNTAEGASPADHRFSPDADHPVYHVGNDVSAPSVIFKVDPEYTDQARQAKLSGTVLLSLEIDTSGGPRNIKVIRGLGLGLDENAVEAVHRWRFRPAYKDGQAVAVAANLSVDFRLL